MPRGAFTGYIDVAQVVLYAFWVFFAGLIFYLRREDKREGYPLESDRSGSVMVQGFPAMPGPKSFLMSDGSTRTVPNTKADRRDAPVVPLLPWPGAPMEPTGDPMKDGVGPASYANREDVPEHTIDGAPSIVPLRTLPEFSIGPIDADPRGMTVIGADGLAAGTVKDVWVDRAESLIRYLEVDVSTPAGARSALLPMTMARIWGGNRTVKVRSILAAQFADVPGIASANQITKREEDRIVGYFAGGTLYATPSRMEPLL
jgi:photosynthetic reaction center H subunit